MYKILRADRDAYITNRKIDGKSRENANTGRSGTLDLFKIAKDNGEHELSRLLIHFDLASLRKMVEKGALNPLDDSFECLLRLKDVYGGQTTPENFTIHVAPLSRSFAEGSGRDVVQYTDDGVVNFLTSSFAEGPWNDPGANKAGTVIAPCDYFQSFGAIELNTYVDFETGEEDLLADVTESVRLMLLNELPDAGFRVSLDGWEETNDQTYFVKRFGSRSAYDSRYWPELVVKFDDSYEDEQQLLALDSETRLFFHHYVKGQPKNVFSGSTELVGPRSMLLKLTTEVSGGYYEMLYDADQLTVGGRPVTGVYATSVKIDQTDEIIAQKMELSGSVMLWPIWSSPDEVVNFYPERKIKLEPDSAQTTNPAATQYTVTTTGVKTDLLTDDNVHVRVNFFEPYSKFSKLVKAPIHSPGIVVRDTFWSIRNADTNRTVIPFDTQKRSTKLSSDADGLFFVLDGSNLPPEQRYVIDIKTVVGNTEKTYYDVSPVFRVRTRK